MSRKLKVLVLSKDVQAPGGVENFVATLLAHGSNSVEWEYIRTGEPHAGRGGLSKLRWPFVDNPRLLRRLLKGDIDCLHINPSMNWKAFMRDALLLMTARLTNFKNIVVFFHGWDADFVRQVGNHIVYRFLWRHTYGKAAAFVVLAQHFKQQLAALDISRDRISVHTTMFDGKIFEGLERNENNDIQKRQRILFLSRFIEEKGVMPLLEAFEQIHHRFPDTELVLAGDGPARPSMEEYVQDHDLVSSVVFAGYLSGTDKARMMKNSDIFVLPTNYPEGCPVALLEAMAAGLPIVTTPVGGIPDIFEDGKNGILLHSVSSTGIAEAISKILSHREWRQQVSHCNEATAWATYEARIVTQKMITLYRQVASRTR